MVAPVLVVLILAPAISRSAFVVENAFSRPDTLDLDELVGELDEAETDHAYLSEWLETLRERPRDLNTAEVEDLTEIPFLSPADAMNIVRHRVEFGSFSSVDSLVSVDGLDPLQIRRLRPFLKVDGRQAESHRTSGEPSRAAPASHEGPRTRRRPAFRADVIQRWTRKLEPADGFRRDSAGYIGGPDVLQTRIRLRLGRLATNLTLDKDAGEPMTWDPKASQFGYDFIAGHLAVADAGWIRHLVVGDFSVRFAFGNVLRSPGGLGSGASSPSIRGASIRPFASSSEAGHFRGVAVEIEPNRHVALSAFASRRRFDARLDTTSGADSPLILRRSTGLHRTATEMYGRHALRETATGTAARLTIGPVFVAWATYLIEDDLDAAPFPVGENVRRRTAVTSLTAGAAVRNLYFSGEYTPRRALSIGVEFQTGRLGSIRTRIRRFASPAYLPHSVQSNGSSGRIEPRVDATTHLRFQPTRRTSMEVQMDLVRLEARSDRRPFTSVRTSGLAELRHRASPWLIATLRTTQRLSEDPSFCETATPPARRVRCLSTTGRRSLRLQLDYHHSRTLESRIRMEFVRADRAESVRRSGMLVYHEIRIRPIRQLMLAARLSSFSVDDHMARVYTHEYDLLYAFSSPAFTGHGRRAFLFIRLVASKTWTLEAKCSVSTWENVKSVGSGRDKIEGNRVRELRLQLRWRPFD